MCIFLKITILIMLNKVVCSEKSFPSTTFAPLTMTKLWTSHSPLTASPSYGEVEYPWQTGDDPAAYYRLYCSWSCSGPRTPVLGWTPYCYPCSCSAFCQEYGTCCPGSNTQWTREIFTNIDVQRSATNLTSSVGTNRESSLVNRKILRQQFTCEYGLWSHPVLVVTRCPRSEVNNSLVDLCETGLSEAVNKYVPLSDQETGMIYRNVFCLICSVGKVDNFKLIESGNVYSLKPVTVSNSSSITYRMSFKKWTLRIACNHYQTIYFVTSEDAFLMKAKEQSEICDVQLVSPLGLPNPEECEPQFFWPKQDRDFTACNHPDKRLEQLCTRVDQLAFSTSYGGINLFCMLCDGRTPSKFFGRGTTMTTFPTILPTTDYKMSTLPLEPSFIPPLSLLLGVARRGRPQLPRCSNITWWDDRVSSSVTLIASFQEFIYKAFLVIT